jgi:uncharacterized protein
MTPLKASSTRQRQRWCVVADGTGAPLDARELPAVLARAHAALEVHRESIDDLNVFPVPDGDTGTNMALTMQAALDGLEGVEDRRQAAQAVIRGAIRGARGNSGVILSQVIRAVVEVVAEADLDAVDAAHYASALEHARTLAYDAVADPVEGTILTVATVAAQAARGAAEDGADLVTVSAATCEAVSEAVARTTEQLDVLREAGVVDAGARGFEVVLGAVHAHLTGQEPPELSDATPSDRPHQETCEGSLSHRFEVQYLLDADDEAVGPLRRRLEVLGDSVVVVAAGGLLNVHVHTDDVGGAIEEGLAFGRPSEIGVTHFGDQISARRDARGAVVGAVAVLDGDGAIRMAQELGAIVVSGAAGALPSVADLLNAMGDVRTERVVILPGHRNAVPTAHQTVSVAVAEGGRPLEVVDAADSPCAVLAALAVLEPAGPIDRVVEDMRAAARAVRSGEVVAAVRDADTPIGRVQRGQPLAVVEGEVVGSADDPLDALGQACDRLGVVDAEVVTLLLGAEAPPEERDRAERLVRQLAHGDVEVLDTGHGPARYTVGVE